MTDTSNRPVALETHYEPAKSADVPASRIGDYRIGGLDKRGRRVLDIMWTTKDFVIFQHEKGISPHFSDDYELSREQARHYMQLGPDLSRINALLPPPTEADEKRHSTSGSFFHTPDSFLYRETARSIANALVGDHQRAVDILAFVETRLVARRRTQGQIQYLLACTGTLLAVLLFAMVFEFFFPSPAPSWRDLVRVATCGAAGGFFSVAIGIRKLDIDPDTRLWVNTYYGLIRLTIAIVSAIVLYFLIKAKLVLEPVFRGPPAQEAYALYAFAVAAGFSETMIPNILRKTEDRSASPTDEARIRSPGEVLSVEIQGEATRPANSHSDDHKAT